MLRLENLRKVVKAALVIFIGISLSGCYNLKTISLNNVRQLSPARNIMLIHAADSLWAVSNFIISENKITGHIFRDSLALTKLKVTHLYVAPLSAVKIEGRIIVIQKENIGKTDYFALNWWEILALFLCCLSFTSII